MRSSLSNPYIYTVVGGVVFWLCLGIVRILVILAGEDFEAISVKFLTLFAPLITCATIYFWYTKILPNPKTFLPAVLIGIVGPIFVTYIIGFFVLSPALQYPAMDVLSFLGMFVVFGQLSVLGYSGMLYAMGLNMIAAPVCGWWLSKQRSGEASASP
jgi:hypothetical protein